MLKRTRRVAVRCGVIGLLALAGCADLREFINPTPPRPAASSLPKPEPDATPIPPRKREAPPPPLLAPQVGKGDETRLRRETEARIQQTEQKLGEIDPQRLGVEDRETLATIRSFLVKAKDALSSRDFLRAASLSEKAQVLANDLSARGK
jgi:hypothetical protein